MHKKWFVVNWSFNPRATKRFAPNDLLWKQNVQVSRDWVTFYLSIYLSTCSKGRQQCEELGKANKKQGTHSCSSFNWTPQKGSQNVPQHKSLNQSILRHMLWLNLAKKNSKPQDTLQQHSRWECQRLKQVRAGAYVVHAGSSALVEELVHIMLKLSRLEMVGGKLWHLITWRVTGQTLQTALLLDLRTFVRNTEMFIVYPQKH